jgi:hypothetical protein
MANMLQSGGTCAVEENLKMSILVELKEEWSQQTKMVGHTRRLINVCFTVLGTNGLHILQVDSLFKEAKTKGFGATLSLNNCPLPA